MHALPHSVPLTLQQATTNPRLRQRLLDAHGWLGQSLVGSLLLSPGSKCTWGFVCALQESVSQSYVKFWQLYGGVNGDLLQEGLCHTQVCRTQSPCPWGSPLLTWTSAGDTQTVKGRSGSVSVGSPAGHKILFESSKHLWWVWGLILNTISPFLPHFCNFSFALGHGVSVSGGIQHSPVNGCSGASCNFGVLTGVDEHMSVYSAILPLPCSLSRLHILNLCFLTHKTIIMMIWINWKFPGFQLLCVLLCVILCIH